uniref:G protein-coupled receptor n=1 Tax=Meloidogyne javanica TaxID=6303 RepID=A0A915N2F2_MELJA
MSGSYLVLTEFVLALVFHSICVYRIVMLLYTKYQSQKAFSLYFMALLINWLITSSLLIPYEVYSAIVWRPQPDVKHASLPLFLIALPCHLFMAMLPVTLFFLTVDRICIIKFGANYGFNVKQTFKIGYFSSLIVCVCVNTAGFLMALPLPEYTECEIFGCILDSAVQFYLGWRAFCAIFNISSGIIFFYLLCRTNQLLLKQASQVKNSAGYQHFLRTNKANNILTSSAILSEFFLSFLPHFGPFLWEMIFGAGSSMGTGPLSEFMSSIEVFIFCITYSHALRIGMEHSSGVIGAETVGVRNRVVPVQSAFRASPSGIRTMGGMDRISTPPINYKDKVQRY